MKVLDVRSLAGTVDRVNEAYFFEKKVPVMERRNVARWIAARRGKPGAYWSLFAPTQKDIETGVKVFTGERYEYAAARHILGEEACRALLLLDVKEQGVQEALDKAQRGILGRIKHYLMPSGIFCCGPCTVGVWRHLLVADRKESRTWIAEGLKTLKAHRKDDGTWRRFPFHYTLLALSEMDSSAARGEMRFASVACERRLSRPERHGKLSDRRRLVAERILEKL
jgi:hypothetical protein